jgi:hypothetical protein
MEDVSHPSVIQLERLAAKLPLPGDEGLESHVAGCAECGARMREVVAERDAFLVANPPGARVAAITGARSGRRTWLGMVGALALAGVAATIVMCAVPRGARTPYVGVKGGAEPKVAVQPAGAVAIGATVTVTLDPGKYAWAEIVSVTPAGIEVLDELPGVKVGDARSYVVDASGGDEETLAVVYAARPLAESDVAAAIAGAGSDTWAKKIAIPKQKAPTKSGSDVNPP